MPVMVKAWSATWFASCKRFAPIALAIIACIPMSRPMRPVMTRLVYSWATARPATAWKPRKRPAQKRSATLSNMFRVPSIIWGQARNHRFLDMLPWVRSRVAYAERRLPPPPPPPLPPPPCDFSCTSRISSVVALLRSSSRPRRPEPPAAATRIASSWRPASSRSPPPSGGRGGCSPLLAKETSFLACTQSLAPGSNRSQRRV